MNKVFMGDCRGKMRELISEGVKVQMSVTSPPYWGLRDYGVPPTVWGGDPECEHEFGPQEIKHPFCQKCGAWLGCLGLEPTPDLYVQHLVEVFRLVRELLEDDGVLFLNLGDSYCGSWGNAGHRPELDKTPSSQREKNTKYLNRGGWDSRREVPPNQKILGLKPKDLVGIPWMVAFALRADGWYLRSEITWCKRAPMPESVQDRPTSATEKIFLLTKGPKYYYDADAVREMSIEPNWESRLARKSEKSKPTDMVNGIRQRTDKQRGHAGFNDRWDAMEKSEQQSNGRNMRNWWLLGPEPYPEAHFATFPSEIPERCILAGSRLGDIVLDPFGGSGTTGEVAESLGRQWILCELNEAYKPLIDERTKQVGMVL